MSSSPKSSIKSSLSLVMRTSFWAAGSWLSFFITSTTFYSSWCTSQVECADWWTCSPSNICVYDSFGRVLNTYKAVSVVNFVLNVNDFESGKYIVHFIYINQGTIYNYQLECDFKPSGKELEMLNEKSNLI